MFRNFKKVYLLVIPALLCIHIVYRKMYGARLALASKISKGDVLLPRSSVGKLQDTSQKDIDYNRVIYTRINKCGSSHVIETLTRPKSIYCTGYRKKEMMFEMFNSTERKSFMQYFMNQSIGSSNDVILHCPHSFFFDFDELKKPQWPAYFSVVRDPLERFISFFYFKKRFLGTVFNDYVNKSLEYCIDNKHEDCYFTQGSKLSVYREKGLLLNHVLGMVIFFCGYQEKCKYLFAQDALQQAKSNIEQHYQVVGLNEEMNATLDLLEAVIPTFSGFRSVKRKEKLNFLNVGKMKEPVAQKYQDILKKSLEVEYDLYHFIRIRMCKQYQQVFPDRELLASCR